MLTHFTNELADTPTGCYGGFYAYITQESSKTNQTFKCNLFRTGVSDFVASVHIVASFMS